jgi:glycine cleavage system H protein
MDHPDDLKYTTEHEWAMAQDDGTVRVGITDFAQDALGDVVYVDLPEEGAEVRAGEPFGEVESTKSVSDLYSPVTGRVVGRNAALAETPELVNGDPYGEGWLVVIEPEEAGQLEGLMDGAAYRRMIEEAGEGA